MQKTLGNQPDSRDNGGASNEASGLGVDAPSTALTTDAGEGIDMADADSTSGRAPAFQFYPKDFLSDERVRLMSLAERGAYITLICHCWSEGTIPADVATMARVIGSPEAPFRKLWPALAPCFKAAVDLGRLIHPRLERERKKQRAFRRKQADNGRKGGRPSQSGKPTANPSLSTAANQSPSSDLISSVSGSKSGSHTAVKEPAADARSNRPVYTSDRFAVFEWQFDELSKMLGSHFEAFDILAFFDALTQQSREDGLVIVKANVWPWLQAEVLEEAKRRKLPMASAVPVRDKAAENRAQDERILAGIQEERRLRAGR